MQAEHVRPLPRDRARRFYDGSAKWLVLARSRARRDRPSSEITALAAGASTRRTVEHQPQAATSTRQADRSRTTSTSGCPAQRLRALHHLQPFVPVSSGNSQDAARRRSSPRTPIPTSTAKLQSFVMPQGRHVLGPVQVNNAIHPHARRSSSAITLLNQQGSQRHPGEHAADPGRQLDRVRAAVLRAGQRRGSSPAVPVRRRVLAGLPATRTAVRPSGRPQPAARSDRRPRAAHLDAPTTGTPATTPTTTTTTTPGTATTTPAATTAPTTTTVPPATGSAQELLDQAADDARPGPGRRSRPATSASTSGSSTRPGRW